MNALQPLTVEIAGLLQDATLPSGLNHCRQEREFQRWIYGILRERYEPRLTVLGEASGGGVAAVQTFGAGSWPDVTVVDGTSRELAIEIKCVWRRGLPNRVAHALGQCLLYLETDETSSGYKNALAAFFVVEPMEFQISPMLRARLAKHGIAVAVVSADPVHASIGILAGKGYTFDDFLAEREAERALERERDAEWEEQIKGRGGGP